MRLESCFIIGNGPSVRLDDLNSIASHPSLACNRFHLSYQDHACRPVATFCIDPQMVDDHIDEIIAESAGRTHIPSQFYLRTFRKAGFRAFQARYFRFDHGDQPLTFAPGGNRIGGNGGSVVYTALQFAVSRGARNIFLYGIDHSFNHGPRDEDGLVKDQNERNHFIQGYRKPNGKWFPPEVDLIERAFRLAEEETRRRGINIWNATRGGKLDVFDRLDLEDALKMAAGDQSPPL